MFITPIHPSIDLSKINSVMGAFDQTNAAPEAAPAPGGGSDFRKLFEGLINDVEKTEAATELDAYKLSVGELEDPHTAMINASKAELTLSTVMQIRNKVLDAYTEVMRINV